VSAAPEEKEVLTQEQAKLLAGVHGIENDLAGDELPHDAEGNPVAPAEPVDKVAGNRALLQFLVTAATPALPFLPECYTPEVIDGIAGAYTAVEEKYGWDVGSAVGPEVALAIFALPPSYMAYTMGKAHFAELRARREAADKAKAQGSTGTGLEGANATALGGG
jgi:hypothetical protein